MHIYVIAEVDMKNPLSLNCAFAMAVMVSFVDINFVSAQNPRTTRPTTGDTTQGGASAPGVNRGTNSDLTQIPVPPTRVYVDGQQPFSPSNPPLSSPTGALVFPADPYYNYPSSFQGGRAPSQSGDLMGGSVPENTMIPHDTSTETAVVSQQIREAIMNDASLSGAARNIQITAQGESLTLSGSVSNSYERDTVERLARERAGSLRIINSVRVR